MKPLAAVLSGRNPVKGLTITTLLDGSVVTSEDNDPDHFWRYGAPMSGRYRADREEIGPAFESYVDGLFKRCGPVFACVLVRSLLFSEARFLYQEYGADDGRPGRFYRDPSLSILEEPWPGATTADLLVRMEQDASLAGNFFATDVKGRIRRMRPDWVTIISGVRGDPDASPWDLDAEVLYYLYSPRRADGSYLAPVLLTPDRVVHYAPIPDPTAQWRGMSWMTPVIGEIFGDLAATRHKTKFFENGGTPSFVVKYDSTIAPEVFQQFVTFFDEQVSGVENAYRILHLGGGADATTVGADMRQLDFKATQGAGETRIAAASGVGALVARFSEGMQGSSLNSGNYDAAKRQFSDMTMRPLWRTAAGVLEKFPGRRTNSRLAVDTRDIAFLQTDEKAAAEIQAQEAQTIATLIVAGYVPESATAAVAAGGDWSLLEHRGVLSVQLQPAPVAGTGGEES
jgi:phage portal protein BeeE